MAKYMDETAFGYFWRSILKPRLDQLVPKEPGKGLSANDFSAAYKNQVDQNKTDVAELQKGKVDREEGKGLSTNDFTAAYKNQVDQNKSDVAALQNGKLDKSALGVDPPEPLGTSSAGVSGNAARSDHVHALPTAVQVGAYDRSGIRTAEFSISVQDWNGEGPYTAAIANDSVTERTDCRFELNIAALQADIDWTTADGAITLSTAKKPAEAIAGRITLTEVM